MARRNLTVALVTETYAPEVNGVAMTLGRLVAGLAERGHRPLIARPRQKQEVADTLPDGQLLTPGLPIPGYPELRFGLPAGERLRRQWLQERPDVVHIATEGPLGLAALAAARRLDLPVLSTFHTNFDIYSRHYGVGWLRGGIERYLRWFHNRTLATLVPTSALATDLTRRGYRNVRVLARGVDTGLFRPERRSVVLRADWEAGGADLVVLCVGRLAAEKNHRLALRAFDAIRARQPNARMVCVGDGPLRASLGRDHPRCRFVGMQQGAELAAHYASADLFLFPSQSETFGNVVCEALASGLPTVAYDLAAAGELIADGGNGWRVPAGAEDAFIAAACRAAANPERLAAMRPACAASVAHLAWERIHDGYAEQLGLAIARHERACSNLEHIRFAPD